MTHSLATIFPLPRFVLLLVLLAPGAGAATDEAGDPFDILGFRLGMTAEEVEATFRRHRPEIDLQIQHATYHYSDGLRQHKTEPFLEEIAGHLRDPASGSTLHVTVEFSPPPDGGRAVQIVRSDANIVNPITLAEYREALIGKYGQPASERFSPEWHFPAGRSLCSSSANGPVAGNFSTLAQGVDRDQKLADPSRCASYLVFRMKGDPVTGVYARMVDVEGAIRTHLAASAWVAELEAEAVARRKAEGRGPEL